MKIWIMVLSIYVAPSESVDWDGPWKFEKPRVQEQTFNTEIECRSYAVHFIGRLHQVMTVPMRFKCVSFDASIHKGEPF